MLRQESCHRADWIRYTRDGFAGMFASVIAFGRTQKKESYIKAFDSGVIEAVSKMEKKMGETMAELRKRR